MKLDNDQTPQPALEAVSAGAPSTSLMASPDIEVREGILFEWLDAPSTPNRRWRAQMSREVFASLVKEKLGADRGDSFLTAPPGRRRN